MKCEREANGMQSTVRQTEMVSSKSKAKRGGKKNVPKIKGNVNFNI